MTDNKEAPWKRHGLDRWIGGWGNDVACGWWCLSCGGDVDPGDGFVDGHRAIAHKIAGDLENPPEYIERECPVGLLAVTLDYLEMAEHALRIADVHLGWGDCTLENVHEIVRTAIAKATT